MFSLSQMLFFQFLLSLPLSPYLSLMIIIKIDRDLIRFKYATCLYTLIARLIWSNAYSSEISCIFTQFVNGLHGMVTKPTNETDELLNVKTSHLQKCFYLAITFSFIDRPFSVRRSCMIHRGYSADPRVL